MPADPFVPRLRPGLYAGDYGHGFYGTLLDLEEWRNSSGPFGIQRSQFFGQQLHLFF